jgi:hypothetical protein
MVSLGVNPAPGTSTRDFTLYPWITSGCTCSQNDFDIDTNNTGDQGSASFTSRGGGFTQSFSDATLSANDVWNHDNITGWTDDNNSADYGIWTMADSITTYTTPAVNGNYETVFVANYLLLATNPTANPILSGGNPAAFRIYLPTDAGAAPSKPYIEQFVTQVTAQTPSLPVSTPTKFAITVRVENPAAQAITFNASNLVTANIPGGPAGNNAVYAGNAAVSQGSIVSQPAVNGTGNITWNPGSLAAGGTAILSYQVTVTATAGSRIAVTATPASANGTRAQYIDETGNATQTRARYTAGPICELAVTQGLATAAVLSSFNLDARGGATNVEWTTASEAGTVGFNVYRLNGERVNPRLIPASLKPQGGRYQLLDTGHSDPNAAYFIEEVNNRGEGRRYGPFQHFEGIDRQKKMEERRAAHRFTSAAAGSWTSETDARSERAVAVMAGVRATGVVRVPFAGLAGILAENVNAVSQAANHGGISVTSNGTPIGWTSDDNALYFYGEKSSSIYSNDRVYRIELAKGVKMPVVSVTGGGSTVSTFTGTRELESDVFAATVLPLDPESDYWFWEAFISGDPTLGRKTFNVNIPSVASSSSVTLWARLQGAFKDTTHHVKISLNGVPVGDTSWSSFGAQIAKLRVPAAVLLDGANAITVEGVLEGGAPFDIFYVDGFTISYPKLARPEGGQIEVLRNGSVGAGPFGSAPLVLDISTPSRPSVLQGASFIGGMASLVTPASTKDVFLAETFVTPSFLRGSAEARLKTNLRADWLIVAPAGFRTAAESLARLREREGLATYVADLNQIYDEFAGGNATPLAIRDFFKWTLGWRKPPKYFVLTGTGTVDYRGIEVEPGALPPMMTSTPDGLFASDSLFVDSNGDRLPEAAIGRIPVSTPPELSAYVAKLEANDRVDASLSPMIFSADGADQGASFRRDSVLAEAPLESLPATRIYLDDLGGAAARTALINAWHTGSPLMSWNGHGGLDQLSNAAVLSSFDAPDLYSTGRLPIVVAMTCTINRFENGFVDPLGTALTKEAAGGAVAVWSASGLSLHSQASEIQRTFMRLASQATGVRVGDLMVKALAAHANDTSSIYLLLGDPAIRVDLPTEVRNGGGGSPSRE